MNQAIKALFEMRTRDQGSLVPRPRPAFPYCMQATESWAGPGNEARIKASSELM